ncbi:MAG: ABC transporter permease [Opitutaceae bacterium]|nr:ABC transporter permease [Opitutaceae bacterium]MBP9913883.1 ABC transporter permease [Opitutaceae bacterium]
MNFILKMAWRDSRASRRRLVLFSLSVVLGIAALVAIGSFTVNLREALEGQAKGLLGADLVVTSRQPFAPEVQAYLAALGGEQAREVSFSSMMVFNAPEGERTRLVQVRAVEGHFPFYGEFVTEPVNALAELRNGGATVVLEDTLLNQFGVKAGDTVKLGKLRPVVLGAVKKVPGESPAITQMAPRAYLPLNQLPATALAGPGSLLRYRIALKLPEGRNAEAIVGAMKEKFVAQRLSFDTVAERQRELGNVLENVYSFLSLVGFVALFLGAIGLASAIHVYVRQKITTVAVLRCLGASAWQSFSVYLVQGLALGVLGALLGAALGVGVQLLLPHALAGLLPFDVNFSIAWTAVIRGMVSGLVICLLFTLLPLLAVRKVSPLVALRAAFAERAPAADPWRVTLGVLMVGAVVGFAIWQTRSLRIGLGFAAALGVGFGVLAGVAQGVAWAARRWVPRRLPYVVRQGVANLHRPNNRTVLLLLALGLGTSLILTLYLTRTTLLSQIEDTGGGGRSNLLFFDIQDDQIAPLEKLLAREGLPARQQAPIVTMRVLALKGRGVEELLADKTSRIPAWTLRREYRSTFRDELTTTETLVGGKFTGRVSADATVVPISLEEGLARDMDLKLGDELEFDVQGVPFKARVDSLRKVEWKRLQPNFFIVFPAGVLEGAPKFYIVATRAATPADSARLQQAVVHDFPNISAIDLTLLLQMFDQIFSKIAYVVRFMAFFTVATGVIVLVGAVLSGRYQRIRETVLLRTLGATRRQLLQIQFVEYAILGSLGAGVGGLLAVAGNALLAKFIFKTAPVVPLGALSLAVLGVAAVTLLTGLLSNRGVTDHPPLEVLRQET